MYRGILRLDAAQADEARWSEYAGLHHQHERGAAAHRPHGGIVHLQHVKRFAQRPRLFQLEGNHGAGAGAVENAARSRSANAFSISFAFDFTTGDPSAPSLPVSEASISYWMRVVSPSSVRRVSDVAASRPTMPMGTPSTFASISRGGSIRVISTTTLNLSWIYATLVSSIAS